MKISVSGLLLLIILAGCSSSKHTGNMTSGSLFQKWDLIWLNGDSVHINDERPVYVEFRDSAMRMNGFGGCNIFFSTFTIQKNLLNINPVASTKMACLDENTNKIENGLFRVFNEVTSYKIENNQLKLNKGNSTLAVFSKSNIVPDDLAGHWELFYITGRKIAFNGLYPEKKPWLEFTAGRSTFNGFTSCNQMNASFNNSKSGPLFKAGAMTLKACPGEGEIVFLDAFNKVDNYTVSIDTLSLNEGTLNLMKFIRKNKSH